MSDIFTIIQLSIAFILPLLLGIYELFSYTTTLIIYGVIFVTALIILGVIYPFNPDVKNSLSATSFCIQLIFIIMVNTAIASALISLHYAVSSIF